MKIFNRLGISLIQRFKGNIVYILYRLHRNEAANAMLSAYLP